MVDLDEFGLVEFFRAFVYALFAVHALHVIFHFDVSCVRVQCEDFRWADVDNRLFLDLREVLELSIEDDLRLDLEDCDADWVPLRMHFADTLLCLAFEVDLLAF